jgi:hypothetical protein
MKQRKSIAGKQQYVFEKAPICAAIISLSNSKPSSSSSSRNASPSHSPPVRVASLPARTGRVGAARSVPPRRCAGPTQISRQRARCNYKRQHSHAIMKLLFWCWGGKGESPLASRPQCFGGVRGRDARESKRAEMTTTMMMMMMMMIQLIIRARKPSRVPAALPSNPPRPGREGPPSCLASGRATTTIAQKCPVIF